MAQYDSDGNEGQQASTKFDLKGHLHKYKVPNTGYQYLLVESITFEELVTFTIDELTGWCNEHSLKIVEKKRFINAVKSLPNSQANKKEETKIKVQKEKEFIFLGNEEKEQINTFGQMQNNIKKMINVINDINNKKNANVENVIEEINGICKQVKSLVEILRNNLTKQVLCCCCFFRLS